MTNKIMELADAYVNACVADKGTTSYGSVPTAHRATLQAEVEKIEAENADHIQQLRKEQITVQELRAELAAAKADVERMNHLVSNVRCADANIDGRHIWNFLWNKGWSTGASFREAVDNAMKGQP